MFLLNIPSFMPTKVPIDHETPSGGITAVRILASMTV